jgi:hypothetical protein
MNYKIMTKIDYRSERELTNLQLTCITKSAALAMLYVFLGINSPNLLFNLWYKFIEQK